MRVTFLTVMLLLLGACNETPDQQFDRACREAKEVGPPIYDPEGACKFGRYLSPQQKQRFAEVWFELKKKMDEYGVKNLRLDENGNLVVP